MNTIYLLGAQYLRNKKAIDIVSEAESPLRKLSEIAHQRYDCIISFNFDKAVIRMALLI